MVTVGPDPHGTVNGGFSGTGRIRSGAPVTWTSLMPTGPATRSATPSPLVTVTSTRSVVATKSTEPSGNTGTVRSSAGVTTRTSIGRDAPDFSDVVSRRPWMSRTPD